MSLLTLTSRWRRSTVFLSALVFAALVALFLGGTPGQAASGATFTVDSIADDPDDDVGVGGCEPAAGECTLRAAIEEANFKGGADTINFSIGAGAVQTITPASALPTITSPVTIDGYTEPGASANTNGPGLGSNAVLKIELDGSGAGAANGQCITAGFSTWAALLALRLPPADRPAHLARAGHELVQALLLNEPERL